MPWDPDRYLRFSAERFAPFYDLLALIERRPGLRVIDLGCGTGELTARLGAALQGASVLGIDSSEAMLERARPAAGPNLRFELRSIEDVLADPETTWDLVFSNAALHWVEDHPALFARLYARLAPRGQLAVQVPSNHNHPAHRLIDEVAGEPPFAAALGGYQRRTPVLSLDAYAEVLFAQGAQDLVVLERLYPHVLPDAGAIADWTSSTTQLAYTERLPPALAAAFEARVRERLAELYPGGPLLYGFRRTFVSARRP